MSHRTEQTVSTQLMFLDGDWNFASSTRPTTGDGAVNGPGDADPRPTRAPGRVAPGDEVRPGELPPGDEVPPGDEDNEHPANAATRTNTAGLGMTAIVS